MKPKKQKDETRTGKWKDIVRRLINTCNWHPRRKEREQRKTNR